MNQRELSKLKKKSEPINQLNPMLTEFISKYSSTKSNKRKLEIAEEFIKTVKNES